MHFFASIWKNRAAELSPQNSIPETTRMTAQEQALLNYNTINKDALIRERHTIKPALTVSGYAPPITSARSRL